MSTLGITELLRLKSLNKFHKFVVFADFHKMFYPVTYVNITSLLCSMPYLSLRRYLVQKWYWTVSSIEPPIALYLCLHFSMVDTYMDEFGLLDFQRSQHGSGMSCRSQVSTHYKLYMQLFTLYIFLVWRLLQCTSLFKRKWILVTSKN